MVISKYMYKSNNFRMATRILLKIHLNSNYSFLLFCFHSVYLCYIIRMHSVASNYHGFILVLFVISVYYSFLEQQSRIER